MDPNNGNNTSDPVDTTVNPAVDLSITKTDSPDPVTYGNELTYTLTATNGGPNTATDVVITDQLPAQVEFVSADNDCAEAGGTVTCNVGALASGASVQRQIVVRPTATGTVNNTATVSSPTADPNQNNNTDTATTQVNAADLTIDKSDSEDPIFAGENFDYILRVTNEGVGDARDVVVTDRLPDGLEFVEAQDCSYNPANRVVTCQLGTMNVGSPAVERRITVTAPADPTMLRNTATVRSPNDPTNGRDTERTTTVVASANLSITKDAPVEVTDEDTFTYTLTVSNAGPSTAEGVSITDELPAGVRFVSADNGCDYDPGTRTVTCNVGDLARGGTAERQIIVQAKTPGDKVNSATVSSQTRDPNGQNNSSTATTTVNAAADLSITKSDSPDPVDVGQELTYTLSVTNDGPSDATGVTVTDDLPNSVTYDASSSPECSVANPTENVVECGPVGLAASGQGATRTFTIKVTVQAEAAPSITNTASVDGNEPDPDGGNNEATENTAVDPVADLSIDKQAPPTATDGQRFSYVLDVANDGPSDATGVVVTDELPAGVSFVLDDTDNRCQYDADTRTVTCELGDLANGDTTEVQISVRATQPGPAQNSAGVDGNEADPDPNNDTDTATTQVNAAPGSADLAINKQAPSTAVDEGYFTYNLAVRNNGPDAAAGVIVEDELPAGVQFVSASQGCSYDSNDDTVTCVRNRLPSAAGQNQAMFTIRVKAKEPGKKINRATVTSPTEDHEQSDMSNNSDTATTMVRPKPAPSADLSLRKSAPGTVTEGKNFTYTLTVRNNGPDAATGVVVKDRLPGGVSFVSASGSCKNRGGTVTCSAGKLNDGATLTKKIVVRADGDGRLRNSATVRSKVGDPILRNNSDTETTRARPERDGPCTKDQAHTSNTSAQDGCGRKPQASTSHLQVRGGR